MGHTLEELMKDREKLEEKIKEILKPCGERVLDRSRRGKGGVLGDVIDRLDELPTFEQVPVATAYSSLYQLYSESLSSAKSELCDREAYFANLVRTALGKPRKWFVYVVQFTRPHDFIICTVRPFGCGIDDIFAAIEKKEDNRDQFDPPQLIEFKIDGKPVKVRLSGDFHKTYDEFGYCRRLDYEEVLVEQFIG